MVRRNRYLIPTIILILYTTLTSVSLEPKLGLDKFLHFGAFGFLAVQAFFKFWDSKYLLLSTFGCIVFGLGIEIAQSFTPERSPDFYDIIANTVGIITAYFLYKKYKNWVDNVLIFLGA